MIVPLFVTQLNCQAAFGLTPRRFRELIRALRLPVVELGKLRGVDASALLNALRDQAVRPEALESNRDRLRRIAGLQDIADSLPAAPKRGQRVDLSAAFDRIHKSRR